MPTPLSAGKKPKVADRRYLRPAEREHEADHLTRAKYAGTANPRQPP
jgi:hypothetical protein